tara:strand:+ start:2170 stop:2382 length:213 start_codon:yes stop_codon:yes gene_type:complete
MSGSLGVRVKNGRCSLYHTTRGILTTFGNGCTQAIINGNEVHVTLNSGSVAIYEINQHGTGVNGPRRIIT